MADHRVEPIETTAGMDLRHELLQEERQNLKRRLNERETEVEDESVEVLRNLELPCQTVGGQSEGDVVNELLLEFTTLKYNPSVPFSLDLDSLDFGGWGRDLSVEYEVEQN
jgi:hypothetical protein